MSLEQTSFLAQIISAAAVIASLIFVGVQLRQTIKAVRAASSQAHSAMYHSIGANIVDNGEFASIWRRSIADPDSVNDDERARFFAFASMLCRFYESSRMQWLRGQLEDGHWHMIEAQAIDFAAQPGIQAWWLLRRHWHSEEFRSWFEGLPVANAKTLYGRPAAKVELEILASQAPGAET
ncbi:MAG: hypothetical protein ACT4OE_07110 [Sphingosinicella sp.]